MTMSATEVPYAEEVQAGAALLDEKAPRWFDHVELDDLNLGDIFGCVLGQVYGDYFSGVEAIIPTEVNEYGEVATVDTGQFGFMAPITEEPDIDWVEHLDHHWRRVITERRTPNEQPTGG